MKEAYERLGYVLHWIGSGIAGLLIMVAGGYAIASKFSESSAAADGTLAVGVTCVAYAAVIWFVTRVCKFVFAGE